MFAQDELSLGDFPINIVEDSLDPISCKSCRACFNAYTIMTSVVILMYAALMQKRKVTILRCILTTSLHSELHRQPN